MLALLAAMSEKRSLKTLAAQTKYPNIVRHARTLRISRKHLFGVLEGKYPDRSGLARKYFDLAEKDRVASDQARTPQEANLEWVRAISREASEKINALRDALKKLRANPADFDAQDECDRQAKDINGSIASLGEAFERMNPDPWPVNPLPDPSATPPVEPAQLSAAKTQTQNAQ